MNKIVMMLALLMATVALATGEDIVESPDTEAVSESIEEAVPPEPAAPARKSRAKPAPKPDAVDEAKLPVVEEKPMATPLPETPAPVMERAPLTRYSLGVHLSYWNAKDLKDFDYRGFVGSGIVGHIEWTDLLALQLRAGGYVAGYEERVFVPARGWFNTEIAIAMVPLEAGLVASRPMGNQLHLYGGGGVGFYLFDGEYTSKQGRWRQTYDMKLDNEFGFFGLAGLRYQLSYNSALFLEAKYTVVETALKDNIPGVVAGDQTGSFPLEKDLDMSGLSIQAGFLFTF